MHQTNSEIQGILETEYQERIRRNPRYSLRAYAKALDLDPGTLSRVLSGKRKPSLKFCRKLFEKLELTAKEQEHFWKSIQRPKTSLPELDSYQEVDLEKIKVLQDWYHFALLELSYVKGFRKDFSWIARKLGISVIETQSAWNRLVQLGFLVSRKGKWVKAEKKLVFAHKEKSTASMRRYQRQLLEKAVYSLENDPIDKRDAASMVFAINPKKIHRAKSLTKQYIRELSELLEKGRDRKVYHLAVHLYPVETSN